MPDRKRLTEPPVAEAGGIDISFNLISHGDVQGVPLAEMDLQDFERPVVAALRTMFLTSRAAARHMMRQRGVVDTLPEDFDGREAVIESIEGRTMLKRAATRDDVGNVAAFAASDWARTLTATSLNITGGAQPD
jgi:3-oxoacyl-[acyl-carrier protein] reductase